EPWMSNNALAMWSLYHDLFGLQPTRGGLVVRPLIHPEMVGSIVKYNFRGTHSVELEIVGTESWRVTSADAIPIVVQWQRKTPGSSYTVLVDGMQVASGTVADDGIVAQPMNDAGMHLFELQ